MAWNRPDENATKRKTAPRFGRGALAGVIVAALAAGALYWLMGGDPKPAKKAAETAKKPAQIVEVQPSISTNVVEEEEVAKPEKPKYWEVDAAHTNGFSKMMMLKWEHYHRPPAKYTNDTSRVHRERYEIFAHRSENTIAGYLTITPGTTLIGNGPRIDENFKRDFLKSLEEPIVISKDDSDYDRELKQMVRDAKIEMKAWMDEGKDIGEIFSSTHQELQKLASYRQQFEKDLKDIVKEGGYTEQDIDDYVTAANMMLEKKGVAPIKLGPISKRALLRHCQPSAAPNQAK